MKPRALASAASADTLASASRRFAAIKTIEQQDLQALQALHRLRQLLVHQRTSIINQVRGVLAKRGIVVAQIRGFKRNALCRQSIIKIYLAKPLPTAAKQARFLWSPRRLAMRNE
jgi:transposase